jgi:hypothetical protein
MVISRVDVDGGQIAATAEFGHSDSCFGIAVRLAGNLRQSWSKITSYAANYAHLRRNAS